MSKLILPKGQGNLYNEIQQSISDNRRVNYFLHLEQTARKSIWRKIDHCFYKN